MADAITLKGDKELMRKIKRLQGMEPVKAALKSGALHVKGKIAQYPPQSEANMPRTDAETGYILPWYERGWGVRYFGGGGRKTSETLGRKWTIGERDGGLTWIVGNNVSYGIFVQGEQQAWFHEERGWKTTDTVVAEERDRVLKFVKSEVDKALEK